MPQNTPVHKIHMQNEHTRIKTSLPSHTCSFFFLSPSPLHPWKDTSKAQSLSDTDLHMISPQCSMQAGRSCSRRGNSVSVCSTEKREGKARSWRGERAGAGRGNGKCKSNIGPHGRAPRIKSNSGKIHIKPRQSQQCPWNAAEW